MTVSLALLVLIAYLLDRNHSRGPTRLAGSADVEDRDLVRSSAEAVAIDRPVVRHRRPRATARTAATARLAIGPR